MLIKCNYKYINFLNSYKARFNKEPTYIERTEAFICARNGTKPNWIY
jgi:hypothetical protein